MEPPTHRQALEPSLYQMMHEKAELVAKQMDDLIKHEAEIRVSERTVFEVHWRIFFETVGMVSPRVRSVRSEILDKMRQSMKQARTQS